MFNMIKRYNKFLSVFLAASVLLGGASFRLASAESYLSNGLENKTDSANKKRIIPKKNRKKENVFKKHPIVTAAGAVGLCYGAYKLLNPYVPPCETEEFVEYVIKKRDVNNYASALLYVTENGKSELALKLLDAIGEMPVEQDRLRIINQQEDYGFHMTPLLYAVKFCSWQVVDKLAKAGADVNIRGGDMTGRNLDAWNLAKSRIDPKNPLSHTKEDFENRDSIFVLLADHYFKCSGVEEANKLRKEVVRILSCGENATEQSLQYCTCLIRIGAKVEQMDKNNPSLWVLAARSNIVAVVRDLKLYAIDTLTEEDKATISGDENISQDIKDIVNGTHHDAIMTMIEQ